MSRLALAIGWLAAGFLGASTPSFDAQAALYWQAGVRSSDISVCFVGDALTSRPDRVDEILEYIDEFEFVANIRFSSVSAGTWQCPPPTTQADGTAYYDGDIRVVLTGTNITTTGLIPGAGCTATSPGSSWSNAPSDLAKNRACLYNLKLGDDADTAGVRWRDHTLHEFGHALGLSHEHVRWDVSENWVKHYLKQIPGVGDSEAQAIYNAGFRTVAEIAGDAAGNPPVSSLQTIAGYSSLTAAQQLRADAQGVVDPVNYGGQAKNGYLTPYDRASLMHYKFADAGIPGNYDHSGFSTWDRLALHILYPEANRVAEFVGATVIPAGATLELQSAWRARSANIPYVAKNFRWRLNGVTVGSDPRLSTTLTKAGTYALEFTHEDFLGRTYSYRGPVRALAGRDYDELMAATGAAAGAMLAEKPELMPLPSADKMVAFAPVAEPVRSVSLAKAKPIGLGPAANGWNTLAIKLSLNPFGAPVDVYVAARGPEFGDEVFLLMPDYSLRPSSSVGIVPWKTHVKGGINEALFGRFGTSIFAPGTYRMYLGVRSSDPENPFAHIWTTAVEMP
jgi:hypothetical protein